MTPAPTPDRQAREIACSLAATWRAMRSIPLDHFPLVLEQVHPIAAFFILRQLKHNGYSNCRVTATPRGLVVEAQR